MPRPPGPGAALLKDPDIRRWYDAVASRSRATADVRLRDLGAFCFRTETDPKALVSKPYLANRQKRLHDVVLDFIKAETGRGITGPTSANRIDALKSWLDHNGVQLVHRIRIAGQDDTPTLRDERAPTQDELRSIFLAGSHQSRAAAVLIAHSGLRPEVLGNYLGTDGLRLRDLPDLEIGKNEATFKATPARVVVRRELSKARHQYMTFLGEEGCRYLKAYLDDRLRSGDRLTPETDVIAPTKHGKDFVRAVNIGDMIRKVIRTAGFQWRPYVLRAYFDTQLLLAESKGKVAHDFRVFWMGHRGSMEARYTTNKGRLPQHFVDEMREAYHRCEAYLGTSGTTSREEVPQEVARSMLDLAGYTEEEIEGIDLTDKEKVRDLVRERLGASGGPRQEVVRTDEVPARLAAGWQFIAALNGQQAVLTAPPKGGTSPTPGASPRAPPGASGPAPPARTGGAGGPPAAVPPIASAASDPRRPVARASMGAARWSEEDPRKDELAPPARGPPASVDSPT